MAMKLRTTFQNVLLNDDEIASVLRPMCYRFRKIGCEVYNAGTGESMDKTFEFDRGIIIRRIGGFHLFTHVDKSWRHGQVKDLQSILDDEESSYRLRELALRITALNWQITEAPLLPDSFQVEGVGVDPADPCSRHKTYVLTPYSIAELERNIERAETLRLLADAMRKYPQLNVIVRQDHFLYWGEIRALRPEIVKDVVSQYESRESQNSDGWDQSAYEEDNDPFAT